MGRTESAASPPTATLPPRAPVPALLRPATGLLLTVAGVSFVAHMLVAGNYGYFRDELYYIADGHHCCGPVPLICVPPRNSCHYRDCHDHRCDFHVGAHVPGFIVGKELSIRLEVWATRIGP